MDDVLRRRLIGATVLLSAAFLLASLLPDPARRGPAGASQVVTYDLRTGQPLGVREDAAQPAAPVTAPEAAADAAPVTPASGPRPMLKVDESLGTAPGAWYLQIGSFENQVNARNVLQKLYGVGLPTTIQSLAVGKKLWYRVRVGPFANEAAAQEALAKVRQQGYPLARIVRPDASPGSERS